MADRKDEGGGGEPLDKVLSKLDALGARMDALETSAGSKNPLKADKGRKDDDDDEDEPEEKKDDDEGEEPKPPPFAKKGDDDDDDDDDEGEQDPEKKPPPPVADKKKDARKDQGLGSAPAPAVKEPPVADKKKDSKKSDEFPPPKEGEEKKDDDDDDDDDDRKDSVKKADSVKTLKKQIADQAAQLQRLTAMMKPRTDDEHAAFADTQAKADGVFAGFGKRAPRPLEGESHLQYRKRLATLLKPYSETWKAVKFSQLPEEAFNIAEEKVYADAVSAAANPTDLEEGELREVSMTDPRTGMKTNLFYGKDSFVKSMGRPARRVASFRTQPSH